MDELHITDLTRYPDCWLKRYKPVILLQTYCSWSK